MMTYLVVWFSSEGEKPSEITQRLLSMGFQPLEGQYDYVYEWPKEASVEDILKIDSSGTRRCHPRRTTGRAVPNRGPGAAAPVPAGNS